MTIKTGKKKFKVDQGKVRIIGETDFRIQIGDALLVSRDKEVRFDVKEDDTEMELHIGPGKHWSYDYESRKFKEKLSQVPVEIPEEMRKEETLQQKMERFLVGMMEERYGRDNVETMAESMDFDIDDDGEVALSGYETDDDFIPEEPVRFDDDPPAAPAPAEPPSDSPTESVTTPS